VDPCRGGGGQSWIWISNSPLFSPSEPTITDANKSSVSSPSFKFQEQPSLVAYDGPAYTPGWMCGSVQRPPVLATFFIFHLETMPSSWSPFLPTYPILLFLLPFTILPSTVLSVLASSCRQSPGTAPEAAIQPLQVAVQPLQVAVQPLQAAAQQAMQTDARYSPKKQQALPRDASSPAG